VIFAEDVEKIFGKRPWVSRSQEIMEANEEQKDEESSEDLKLEDMPEVVKLAQAEYEQSSDQSAQAEPSEKAENTDNA
jgi:cell division protease FtsH